MNVRGCQQCLLFSSSIFCIFSEKLVTWVCSYLAMLSVMLSSSVMEFCIRTEPSLKDYFWAICFIKWTDRCTIFYNNIKFWLGFSISYYRFLFLILNHVLGLVKHFTRTHQHEEVSYYKIISWMIDHRLFLLSYSYLS